ncbi:hypothetical protein CL638_01075 [bacterium]|nr:hypothetical protein [bacterium]
MLEIVWNHSSLLFAAIALIIIWSFDAIFTKRNGFGKSLTMGDRFEKEVIIIQHLYLRKILLLGCVLTWHFRLSWIFGLESTWSVWLATALAVLTLNGVLWLRIRNRPLAVTFTFLSLEKSIGFSLNNLSWFWRDVLAFIFLSGAYFAPKWFGA